MQTKSKKGVQVREYYYELEQVIDQYKEYIIKGLQDKIKKLENNQKPIINPKKGIIYIIETDDDIGHYKIGKTTNLKKRLSDYTSSKKDNIIPLYIYETDNVDEVEKCIKTYAKKFQYRKYKEVYKADINMLKELINEFGEFTDNIMFIILSCYSLGEARLYIIIIVFITFIQFISLLNKTIKYSIIYTLLYLLYCMTNITNDLILLFSRNNFI